MVAELPREPLRMANPYNTWYGCKHARESAAAINLLPFVSAAPKMAVQIPKTCSTQYRLISTACLALKAKDYMGGTKMLTASPFAPSFPGGPGEPRDPYNNNRIIVSTVLTPIASAKTRVTHQDENKEWGDSLQCKHLLFTVSRGAAADINTLWPIDELLMRN